MGRHWNPETSGGPSKAKMGPQRPMRALRGRHRVFRIQCGGPQRLTGKHGALRGQCGALKGRHGPALDTRDQRRALKGQDGPPEADADSKRPASGLQNPVSQRHLKSSLGTRETEMRPPEAGVRLSDAGWAPEAGLGALKGQWRALRGQYGSSAVNVDA